MILKTKKTTKTTTSIKSKNVRIKHLVIIWIINSFIQLKGMSSIKRIRKYKWLLSKQIK